MSAKLSYIYPGSPATTRSVSTKLSASKDKIAYTTGKIVIIRDLREPSKSFVHTGHIQNTTVARISPSGYYCASADAGGTVRVFDIAGEDKVLKGEYKVLGGKINDLEWDGESKRIIAVGDGKEKFGTPFMMDSGSTCGEIIGHSKQINAVTIRHQRPFRAATASDDGTIVFFTGVPFKFEKSIKTHVKFVQDVRFSPSGDHLVSVGSDYKIFIYDGKTGDTLAEFTESLHHGSIMACTWSPDSKQFATSALDGTVKLWDTEARKVATTWTIGPGLDNQQVGNVWGGTNEILSLSFSGDLNIIDPKSGPTRVLKGAQKAITAVVSSGTENFDVGTADGRIFSYSKNGVELISGEGHTSFVVGMALSADGTSTSIGYDDRAREFRQGKFSGASVSTAAQPKAIAITGDSTSLVVEASGVEAFRSNQKLGHFPMKFTSSSIAARGNLVALGGEKVRLYEWDGSVLEETGLLEANKGVVRAVAFSPDGRHLTAGDSSGKVILYDVAKKEVVTSRWSHHSARINSLSWTADSEHCASGSLDTNVYVWSVQKQMKNIALKNAVPGGVNAVLWIGEKRLIAAGADGCVRVWDVTFH